MNLSGVDIKFGGRSWYRTIYEVETLENGTQTGFIILPYQLVKECTTLVVKDKGSIRWRVARES